MEAIPVIDLANFPAEGRRLLAACEELGCFVVVSHGISPELQSGVRAAAKAYFSLSDDVKLQSKALNPYSRSVARTDLSPHLETLPIKVSVSPAELDEFFHQLKLPIQQKEVIKIYAVKAQALAADIAGKIASSLGLDKSYSFKRWSALLRPNMFKFTKESVGSTGLVTHSDSSFLTLLLQDEQVGGLEIVSKSGTFVSADPVPGSLLVFLGDAAKAWSNGRLH